MVKKGNKFVTLLHINVPRVMILYQKPLETYLTREHLFDRKGKLFEMEGHLLDRYVWGIYLTRRDIYFEKGHNFVTNY